MLNKMQGGDKITVLGIGNPLCSDDGIGIRIIGEMRENSSQKGIQFIDGGTAPDLFSLLDEDVTKLIIVDALKGGGPAGSIYRLVIRDSNISEETPVSLHGLGVLDSLLMMKKLGMRRPEVVIVGVEPAEVSPGLKLSPRIETVVPSIIKAVEDEIRAGH
jgi:hydrogenase maturation protease